MTSPDYPTMPTPPPPAPGRLAARLRADLAWLQTDPYGRWALRLIWAGVVLACQGIPPTWGRQAYRDSLYRAAVEG